MTIKLETCPLCGGTASLPAWGGCMEYAGRAWQACTIECNSDGDNYVCDHEVSVCTDSDKCGGGVSKEIEKALIETWNTIAIAMKRKY